jgi:hypothetical protein
VTRNERINKLGNAIKRYRGRCIMRDGEIQKWVTAPQSKSAKDVRRWAAILKLDPDATIRTVDGFKSFDEMRAWIRGV